MRKETALRLTIAVDGVAVLIASVAIWRLWSHLFSIEAAALLTLCIVHAVNVIRYIRRETG